jgi:hypothetical protein
MIGFINTVLYNPSESQSITITRNQSSAELFFLGCRGLAPFSFYDWLLSWVEFYVTTDGQPASLSWNKAPIWGLRPDFYYLCDSYGLVLVWRPLWREDGSVFYICCWPLPAQSLFGPSPLGLATIFYCLRFETSLFVASYDSQGHGGGIRSRLHTGTLTHWLLIYDWTTYIVSRRTHRKHIRCPAMDICEPYRKHLFPHCIYSALYSSGSSPIVACVFVVAGMCLPSRCPATGLHVAI